MPRFDSGVKGYIKGRVTLTVAFPIDWRGRADISCRQCDFFVRATGRCSLNQRVVSYPEKYVGEDCPLEIVTEEEGEGSCVNSEI